MALASANRTLAALKAHMSALSACKRCEKMLRPVVVGRPVVSRVLLIGQAPGAREGVLGRPFAWTAGKQMFKWFASIGLEEEAFRDRVYMAAVCRCFPGKKSGGGDREPNPTEIANCSSWLDREIELNRPALVIPVGRMAIEQLLGKRPLDETVGRTHRAHRARTHFDVVPLPHPSGASTWWKREPGITLLPRALALIACHEAWRAISVR